MNRKYLLLFVLVVQVLFIAVPETDHKWAAFPLAPATTVSPYVWAYYFFEHVAWLAVSWMLIVDTKIAVRNIGIAWMIVQIIDFIDYLLTFNQTWFHVGLLPVTGNIVQMVLFVALTWRED